MPQLRRLTSLERVLLLKTFLNSQRLGPKGTTGIGQTDRGPPRPIALRRVREETVAGTSLLRASTGACRSPGQVGDVWR